MNLIEFPPDGNPYESLKECLPELHNLNPFQMYQALMAFTLAADKKGYFKIPMRPSDIPQTAIITPFRLFKFLHLPFGLF